MGLNDAELKRYIQVFKETLVALGQIEEQVKASSTRLSEVLEEVRAQSQAIFILIDRVPPP